VWDAATGRLLQTLLGHGSAVSAVVFSPDGKRLASSSMGRFSPRGALLQAGEVRLWDAGSGRALLTLKHHLAKVRNVSFSAGGRRLASAGYDGTAKVWEVRPPSRAVPTRLRP
jgi:WD40 repeat protein